MTVADIPAGFDTLAATRDLEAADIERRHAEAVVAVVRASRAGLATKADLDNLEARMDGRFAELQAQMDGRFAELQAQMDGRFAELQAQMDGRFTELQAQMDGRFAEFEARVNGRFAESDERVNGRFAESDERTNGRFAEFEARMLKVAISIVLAQTALTVGLTFGLLKLFGGAP